MAPPGLSLTPSAELPPGTLLGTRTSETSFLSLDDVRIILGIPGLRNNSVFHERTARRLAGLLLLSPLRVHVPITCTCTYSLPKPFPNTPVFEGSVHAGLEQRWAARPLAS